MIYRKRRAEKVKTTRKRKREKREEKTDLI